nr:hypothetical protein CFP56_16894 [Quercus suber]
MTAATDVEARKNKGTTAKAPGNPFAGVASSGQGGMSYIPRTWKITQRRRSCFVFLFVEHLVIGWIEPIGELYRFGYGSAEEQIGTPLFFGHSDVMCARGGCLEVDKIFDAVIDGNDTALFPSLSLPAC